MTDFTRYAIYAVPDGGFFRKGSEWLGWDCEAGRPCTPPDLPGLPGPVAKLTAAPHRYGLHATLKPPFRLEEGHDPEGLAAAARALAAGLAPVTLPRLEIRPLGPFVAVQTATPAPELRPLADAVIAGLDVFRAAPDAAELARRRRAITPRQEVMLARWGYPYVFEEFRFHVTLTGPVRDPAALSTTLSAHFADVLPAPWVIADLAFLGEAPDGHFHLLDRFPLGG